MRKTYAGKEVDVSFDPEVCIHAASCVRGLPGVFDTTRRPWIVPDAAGADDVVAQVALCPSGALQAKRHTES
ncbi:MAG: (4Fe-4S)-binding protein [Solirubrobacteraceae bacterium]